MTESRISTIVLVGSAVVDYAIHRDSGEVLSLPSKDSDVPAFLLNQPEGRVQSKGSGSVQNLARTLLGFQGEGVRFFTAVAEDKSGEIFREQADPRLGPVEVFPAQAGHTPMAAIIIGERGVPDEMRFLPGMADKTSVSQTEIDNTQVDMFVTNGAALGGRDMVDQMRKVINRMQKTGGLFALNLTAVSDKKTTKERLASALTEQLKKQPDIVVGNEIEAAYITEQETPTPEEAILDPRFFPESEIAIITNGEKGSIIRFKDEVITVPISNINQEDVIDTIGAGDAYMATFLWSLSQKSKESWTMADMRKAGELGSYAAGLLIQIKDVRLNEEQIALVKQRAEQIN